MFRTAATIIVLSMTAAAAIHAQGRSASIDELVATARSNDVAAATRALESLAAADSLGRIEAPTLMKIVRQVLERRRGGKLDWLWKAVPKTPEYASELLEACRIENAYGLRDWMPGLIAAGFSANERIREIREALRRTSGDEAMRYAMRNLFFADLDDTLIDREIRNWMDSADPRLRRAARRVLISNRLRTRRPIEWDRLFEDIITRYEPSRRVGSWTLHDELHYLAAFVWSHEKPHALGALGRLYSKSKGPVRRALFAAMIDVDENAAATIAAARHLLFAGDHDDRVELARCLGGFVLWTRQALVDGIIADVGFTDISAVLPHIDDMIDSPNLRNLRIERRDRPASLAALDPLDRETLTRLERGERSLELRRAIVRRHHSRSYAVFTEAVRQSEIYHADTGAPARDEAQIAAWLTAESEDDRIMAAVELLRSRALTEEELDRIGAWIEQDDPRVVALALDLAIAGRRRSVRLAPAIHRRLIELMVNRVPLRKSWDEEALTWNAALAHRAIEAIGVIGTEWPESFLKRRTIETFIVDHCGTVAFCLNRIQPALARAVIRTTDPTATSRPTTRPGPPQRIGAFLVGGGAPDEREITVRAEGAAGTIDVRLAFFPDRSGRPAAELKSIPMGPELQRVDEATIEFPGTEWFVTPDVVGVLHFKVGGDAFEGSFVLPSIPENSLQKPILR